MSSEEKSDVNQDKFWTVGNPVLWGCALTLGICALGVWGAFQPACFVSNGGYMTCPPKWFYLKQSTPNELGDTLAGFAGALAFVWIVVTVLLQSKELQAQREELALTRREFEKMAEAQSKQVELLVKQGEIFAEEHRQRMEIRAEKTFQERLEILTDLIISLPEQMNTWTFETYYKQSNSDHVVHHLFPKRDEKNSLENTYRVWAKNLTSLEMKIIQSREMHKLIDGASSSHEHLEIVDSCRSILQLLPRLSEDQKIRLEGLKLEVLESKFLYLLHQDIWRGRPALINDGLA